LLASALQKAYSVAEITTSETYEKGKPKLGGLSDPRLGTMDRAAICTTDGSDVNTSPGYFGHIVLARPVFHIGFIKTIIRVLRCVSYHTSKLLVDKVGPNLGDEAPQHPARLPRHAAAIVADLACITLSKLCSLLLADQAPQLQAASQRLTACRATPGRCRHAFDDLLTG
jgi:hypothetical protein